MSYLGRFAAAEALFEEVSAAAALSFTWEPQSHAIALIKSTMQSLCQAALQDGTVLLRW